jgi:hypothetical protein
MADGGKGGGWITVLVFFLIVLAALWVFFDLLGFTPAPTSTSAH